MASRKFEVRQAHFSMKEENHVHIQIRFSTHYSVWAGAERRALAAPTPVALAATCTWIGTTGNWSEITNWSCAAVPGSGDTAIIDNGGTVALDMDVTVQSLTLSGYSTLGGSDVITVTNMMAWSSHTSMAGTGATNIASGATLNLTVGWGNYGNHYPILDTRTLNIAGTAILSNTVSADIYSRLGLANGATINNSGILDFQNDTGIAQDNGSTGSVNNSGTFRKSGGTGTSPVSGVLVNNTGTVQAQSGTLSLAGRRDQYRQLQRRGRGNTGLWRWNTGDHPGPDE